MRREAYWRPAKETEANVNSSEYALFTQSHHAWSVKIVLWTVKGQGIFFILMGGNPDIYIIIIIIYIFNLTKQADRQTLDPYSKVILSLFLNNPRSKWVILFHPSFLKG